MDGRENETEEAEATEAAVEERVNVRTRRALGLNPHGPNAFWMTRTVPFMAVVWILALAILIPTAWGLLFEALPYVISLRGIHLVLGLVVCSLGVLVWSLLFAYLRLITRLWRNRRRFFES